jgi:hypothetical protein
MEEIKKKPRRVFGRLKKEIGDETYTFSMQKDGIHVRKYRCQLEVTIPFSHISALAKRQLEFAL